MFIFYWSDTVTVNTLLIEISCESHIDFNDYTTKHFI